MSLLCNCRIYSNNSILFQTWIFVRRIYSIDYKGFWTKLREKKKLCLCFKYSLEFVECVSHCWWFPNKTSEMLNVCRMEWKEIWPLTVLELEAYQRTLQAVRKETKHLENLNCPFFISSVISFLFCKSFFSSVKYQIVQIFRPILKSHFFFHGTSGGRG